MRSPAKGTAPAGVVSDLWRFPVKSFGGERLRRVFVGPFGLLGDRRHAVMGSDGPLTARRAHGLLAFTARYRDQGPAEGLLISTPKAGEVPAGDPTVVAELVDTVGSGVGLDTQPIGFFDAAPVHLLGEASLNALGELAGRTLDRRRFRANIVVDAGAQPFAEDAWIGRRVTVGAAVLEVVVNTERCTVTTFDPETLERDTSVLATLARERDNLFGVYARVITPGWAAVGDPVHVA